MRRILIPMVLLATLMSCSSGYYLKKGVEAYHENDILKAKQMLLKAGDQDYTAMLNTFETVQKDLYVAEAFENEGQIEKALDMYISAQKTLASFIDPNMMMKTELAKLKANIPVLVADVMEPLYSAKKTDEFLAKADKYADYIEDGPPELVDHVKSARSAVDKYGILDRKADKLAEVGEYDMAVKAWKEVLEAVPGWSGRIQPKIDGALKARDSKAKEEKDAARDQAMSRISEKVAAANNLLADSKFEEAIGILKDCQAMVNSPENAGFDLDPNRELQQLIDNAGSTWAAYRKEQDEKRKTKAFNKKWGIPLRPSQLAYTENYKISSLASGKMKRGSSEQRSVTIVVKPGEYRKLNCSVTEDYLVQVYDDPNADPKKNLVKTSYDRNGKSVYITPDVKAGTHKIIMINAKGPNDYSMEATLYKRIDF